MDIARDTVVHWTYWIYIEMFVAGIAAGAYLVAAMLEVTGRGRSPAARAAHLIAFPLMMLSALLLTIDLSRPERFWHMVLMSERAPVPMLKIWSPISFGTYLVLGFALFTFVSFMDAVFDRTRFSLGRWRPAATLHGSPLGLVWALVGGLFAVGVGSYSGLLLAVSSMPGWTQASWLGAVYLLTAALTGAAAILLVRAFWRPADADPHDSAGLMEFLAFTAVAWSVATVISLIAMGDARRWFLYGWFLAVSVVAFLLAGIVPIVARFAPRVVLAPALVGALVLLGGFLFRYATVMGPQEEIL